MGALTEKLWALQTEVSRLHEIEQALSSRPDFFAEVDDRYQMAKQELVRGEQKIEELQKLRRELDRELQAEQESLARYQGQLMQVKNQQQYAAAWKEIDTARKKLKELEPLAQQHTEAYERWQASLGDLRTQAEEVKSHIAAIEPGIPQPILREFHRVREHRNGVAVARVMINSCEGCRVRIRPAVLQQLRRGEVMRCEGCRRILYLESQPVAAQG